MDTMNSSNFSKWMPLTGMYIATATMVCAIAIIGDLVEGLLSKQYWIPSEYTSLNSISLTILGAATRLSMDLSTTMPRQIDQLAKLGTSAFMCVTLAIIYPSLGKLKNSELLSNIVALSILVMSSILSLGIQSRTEVIYTFKTAHMIMLTMMSLLLLHCVLSAGLLSYLKHIFHKYYKEQDQSAQKKWINVEHNKHPQTKNLKQYLKRFSMLAYSSCPHFLLGRSSQGTPPTIYGLVSTITFFVTQITYISHGGKFLDLTSDNSKSVYNWSVLWISTTQSVALGLGTIVLCIRGCYIGMVYLKGMGSPRQVKFDWVAGVGKFQFDYTFYLQHKSPVYVIKMVLLSSCHSMFRVLLIGISVLVFSIIEVCWTMCTCTMLSCFLATRRCVTSILPHSPGPSTEPDALASEVEELSGQYTSAMLGLDSEGSGKWIRKSILDVTYKCMSTKERNTEHVEELLRQHLSGDFRGVVSFDSEEVVSLYSQESPPNCWSLLMVTLTSIAIALPNVDGHSIDKLTKGVNEGLVLVKLIEDKFNNQPHFLNVTYAAYKKWTRTFGLRSGKISRCTFQNNSSIEIIESIGTSAKNDFHKFTDEDKKVAAYCKYRLCETLLLEYRNENQPSSEIIFKKLRATIVDILGACLTNLKYYILTECSKSSSIEKMREAASSILTFFGDTEKIMEIIETKEIPKISWEKMAFIDEWYEYYKVQRQLP